MIKKLIVVMICLVIRVLYADMPVQLSIWPGAQLVDVDGKVQGFRLSLPFSGNVEMNGLDIGLASGTTKNVSALQITGIGNFVGQDADAIQISCVNIVERHMTGCQIAALFNAGRTVDALAIAGLGNNYAEDGNGLFLAGLYNYGTTFQGVSIGVANVATYATGFQVGAVNYAKNANGFQIGVINIISDGVVPFTLGINANF